MTAPTANRREVLAGAGAFVLGFWLPPRAAQGQTAPAPGAAWYTEPEVQEINGWIVVEPDDTVVIRIAQTELGQGVWTSNAMMVCEELQCDWSKVRPIYASVNRDAREMAPQWTLEVPGNGATDPNGGGEPTFGNRARQGGFGIPDSLYRRMRTNAASSVKDGRYYLQLAGAEARERLMLAAANLWSVPVDELTAKDSVIAHARSGRTTTYGKVAHLAARTPHPNPESIALKPPDQWTLMGTEQKNLDIPMKVTGETKYAIDVRLPGMKWAAVKSCPVYGGDVKSYDFDAIRDKPGVRSVHQFPIPDPQLTRGRVFSGGVAVIADSWYQAKQALDALPIEWTIPPERAAFNTANMRAALLAALDAPGRVRVRPRRRRRGVRAGRSHRRGDVFDAVPAARSHGARQRDRARDGRARRHLDRRPEPAGDALQRRADHGHCRRERLSAHVPSRRRLRPQRQWSTSRASDHDRERESRHADSPAVDARGGLHRHDLSRDGYGAAQGGARRGRLAARARGAHEHAAGRLRPRCVVRRRFTLLRAELPFLESHDEFPCARRHAPRRRAGRARVLSRELHRRARARGGQGPVSLSSRAHRAHRAAVQGRHAEGARHGGRDGGLGRRRCRLGSRARSRSRSAAPRPATRRRSARWCTRSP